MDLTPCPVCTRKWGKALVKSCCHCTGHVDLAFKPPTIIRNPKWDMNKEEAQIEAKSELPKIGRKERLRLEKALGRPLS